MATTDGLRAILLADFAAIRLQVTAFLSAQLQFMSFSLLRVGVYAAAYARPIMRGVRYLQQKLRPQLEKLAGDFPDWEQYIREPGTESRLMTGLDTLRWTLFLFLCAFFTASSIRGSRMGR